jgi:hypothetical protein
MTNTNNPRERVYPSGMKSTSGVITKRSLSDDTQIKPMVREITKKTLTVTKHTLN